MPFAKGNPGGPGRPKKIVEDAAQSVLFELFNEQAERDVVKAQIREAKRGNTTAATWLWDRKYGKVPDKIQHGGDPDNPAPIRTVVFYAPDLERDEGPA